MTVMGDHTMEETRQFIAALDSVVSQVSDAFNKSRWTGPDADRWRDDWYDFNQRWIAMKRSVSNKLTAMSAISIGVPASMVRTEGQWQEAHKAVNVSGTGLYTTGDLPDMRNRLEKVVGPFIDQSKIPKQESFDADMAAYLKSDIAVKKVEETGREVKKTAGEVAKSNLGLIVGLGLAGVAATVVATKVL